MLAAKAVTVEWAARIHRVPLNEFLDILDRATNKKLDQNEAVT
jgi:predicted HTH domain antitoxin